MYTYQRGLTLVPHSSRKYLQPFRRILYLPRYQTARIDALSVARNWNVYFNYFFLVAHGHNRGGLRRQSATRQEEEEKWPFQAGGSPGSRGEVQRGRRSSETTESSTASSARDREKLVDASDS
jgi:hypothetical protein